MQHPPPSATRAGAGFEHYLPRFGYNAPGNNLPMRTVAMRIAIVGCGGIGAKRARSLAGHELVATADVRLERARAVAAGHRDCQAVADWEALCGRPDVDVVIVSTTNNMLAPVALAAVQSGKHVLVEKPAARAPGELEPLIQAAADARATVKVGFNHRFHPALLKAREIVDQGALGPLMFIRGRYGHGGRLGMEREWRGMPELSGGGELLDQGVHLIDLSRWFLGDFDHVQGHVARFFWDWAVEDNGFLQLRTRSGQIAWLHASCTEWKNTFSLEIYGRSGKLHVEGLGGSYGVEKLTWYRMLPEMGPPPTTSWEYPGEDKSWEAEFEHFIECIHHRREPMGSLHDALAALKVVETVYEQQRGS